tara:strand:+ start:504 stop:1511 length:1008 start_codon:yes stop_codon:yes gene_type:complete
MIETKKLLTITLSLSFFVLFFGSANAVDQNNDKLLESAMYYIKNDKLTQAIPLLEEVLKTDPNNITILKNLAVAYTDSKMCSDAITLYDKILQLKPDSPEILYGKALCFNNLGEPENALLILDRIDKKYSKDNSILIVKANSNVILREFEKAKTLYEQILDKEPNHKVVSINMLMISHHLNDHMLAKDYLVKIFGNDPTGTSSCGATGCMGNIPFLFPAKNSEKYEITAQTQVRSKSNELVAIIDTNTINYTPHPIFDEILMKHGVFDVIQNKSGTFEITKITQKSKPIINSYFMDRIELFHNDYTVLFGYNLAVPLESGDYIITEWNIKKKINN